MNTDSCSKQEMRSAESEEGGPKQLLSASVASAELARSAFNKVFFQKTGTSVATARAAPAIAGGDWREGRLVPDLVRAIMSAQAIPGCQEKTGVLRIWHVLEPVRGCLLLAKNLFERGQKAARVWDFAPGGDCISTSEFSEKFVALWNAAETGQIASSRPSASISNSERTEAEPGWSSLLSADQALAWTVEWYRGFCSDPASTLNTTQDQPGRLPKDNDLGNLVGSSALLHTRFTYHRTWETGLEVAA
jgi:CDP-glucose 4,6-dehydratase